MFFDKMHEYLRPAGREEASQEDVEWVYVHEMLGVRGQADLQHYEGRLKTILGITGYPVALEILTATAVKGRLDGDAVDRYRVHYSALDAENSEGVPSVADVLHVLQHDGYLERQDGGFRFVSGLLEDWWRSRYGENFVPVVEPDSHGGEAGR